MEDIDSELYEFLMRHAREMRKISRTAERVILDEHIEAGLLPDPEQMSPLELALFEQEAAKLPIQFHINELVNAWNVAQAVASAIRNRLPRPLPPEFREMAYRIAGESGSVVEMFGRMIEAWEAFQLSEMASHPEPSNPGRDDNTDAVMRVHSSNLNPLGLTERQQEVAALTAKGWTKPEIAEELTISKNTVESHWIHIREKVRQYESIDRRFVRGEFRRILIGLGYGRHAFPDEEPGSH